nr:unnamed protein product [Callosobruchus chinensis]
MWEGEDDMNNGGTEPTPKQRLMNWIHTKLPDLPIRNFTTDWNDGKAVGALVDAVAPGLCPDWQDWDSKDCLQNATEAMDLADNWLNIPQLIKPEEIVDPNVDEQSMMTYLSQYPNAKIKPGAPLRPKRDFHNFTVETFAAGHGKVDVTLVGPRGQREPVDVRFNNDKNLTYTATYTPRHEGMYTIHIKFAGVRDVAKSPYSVKVDGPAGDASKVTVSGPGLQPDGVIINKPTHFDINTRNAGQGVPEVIILDPAGNKTSVPVQVRKTAPDTYRCDYVSSTAGLHSINVKVTGRGVQPKGIRVKDETDFTVHTEGAGEGVPSIKIIDPDGHDVNYSLKKLNDHSHTASYSPTKEGKHVIVITFAGPYKETLIRAYGPGLESGIVGYPGLFTVETNGETGALGFSIQGPSHTKIECHDNEDGSADVRYYPTAPGEYAVHILCDEVDIPHSPYMAHVINSAECHPEKVNVFGPGVESNSVQRNVSTKFTVDTRAAGVAPLTVQVTDANLQSLEVKTVKKGDGLMDCMYVPNNGSRHTVEVNYGGVAVKNSPFRVYVSEPVDASKVQCFGPGIKDGVKINTPTHFNIDARDAGGGDLIVHLVNEKTYEQVPIKITDHGDRSYTVDYETSLIGNHLLTLHYGGQKVPSTPIKFKVHDNVDISKIKVDGLEQSAPINSLQQFRVITQDAGKAEFSISITSPSGSRVKAHVIPTHEVNFTPTQLGEYLLGIQFGGESISHRPFKMTCLTGSDPMKVKATGPGLHRGVVNKPAEFMIDTRGAGQGGLGVTVEGPCEAAINCRDNGDGTCSVAYLPTEIGDYGINITFNDKHIPGSPFQAIIVPDVDVNKIKVSGDGIQLHGVYVDSPTDFLVDTRGISSKPTDNGKVTCTITSPSGVETEKLVTSLLDGTYKVSYTPFEEGKHTIDIFYDNMPVPGSPFVVNVRRGCDAKKCCAYGPGLENGILNKPNQFTVETKEAGTGGLSLAIEGPSEAKMTCKDNRDGSCSVEYMPTEPGEYDVTIKFADNHIPGSPFKVQVQAEVDEN